jgi:PDZ domain-containing protein
VKHIKWTRGWLAVGGLVVLGAVFLVLWLTPSGSYVFLPDQAHPVAPLVTVKGEHRPTDGGGIYFVDVIVRKATLLERLFAGVRPDGATLYPANAVNPPGAGESARRQQDLRAMTRSQQIAAAVAERALGYKVAAQPTGALIADVDPSKPAAGKLEPTDVIVGVDGRPVRTPSDLRRLIRRHKPGETVRFAVRSGTSLRTVIVRTVPDPANPTRPIVGVLVDQSANVKLPVPVRIDTQGVGGPSAGLAFALDLMEELGRDVDRGYRVAATGEIALDGSVGPIGGVEQKTIGARRSHVDVFLVPAGDNAREARRYAGGLRIIPVDSFRQALRSLATLPPKA